jgi:hypothetical protein
MTMVGTEIEGHQRYGLHEHDLGGMLVVGMLAMELDFEEEDASKRVLFPLSQDAVIEPFGEMGILDSDIPLAS